MASPRKSVSQDFETTHLNIHALLNDARDNGNEDSAWEDIYKALPDLQADNPDIVNEMAGRKFALLHHAAYHGNQKACDTLLGEYRADPSLKTIKGDYAETVAEKHGHKALSCHLATQRSECEKKLHGLMNGVKDGSQQWAEVYKFLKESKCVVNQRLERSYTFLHHAAFWGDEKACFQLVKTFGADPKSLSGDGQTPAAVATARANQKATEEERQSLIRTARFLTKWSEDFVGVPLATIGHKSEQRRASRRGAPSIALSNIRCTTGKFVVNVKTTYRCARAGCSNRPSGTSKYCSLDCMDEAEKDASAPSTSKGGCYTFDQGSRTVMVDGAPVGTFYDGPISSAPVPGDRLDATGILDLRCIRVVSSEIIEEIQNPKNQGAYFVLPSQLNGAEYPSEESIVKLIEQYKFDHTGGPRGQLAVHPAVGQFILDNASNSESTESLEGINATDIWLEKAAALMGEDTKAYCPSLQNGYLTIPTCPKELWPDLLKNLKGVLHTMRILAMQGVPASGLSPSMDNISTATHTVNMVYSSAIPIDAYQNVMDRKIPANWERDLKTYMFKNTSTGEETRYHPNAAPHQEQIVLQTEIGRLNLIAQYYGAIKMALEQTKSRPATIYLMPLGGGVFMNPMEIIVGGMSKAVELLHEEGKDVFKDISINVLAWKGNPSEAAKLSAELEKVKKLA